MNATPASESLDEAAQRLGLPVAFLRMHKGYHPCVDGRHYRGSCLLTDPSCEHTARYFMKRHNIAGGGNAKADKARIEVLWSNTRLGDQLDLFAEHPTP